MEPSPMPMVFVLIATWWVHSSLLLGGAAVLSIWHRKMSPGASEWLWKAAVVLPWLTAPLQSCCQSVPSIWQWELAPQMVESVPPAVLKPSSAGESPKRSDGPNVRSEENTNWQIEIIPADPPAIAEKPRPSSKSRPSLRKPTSPVRETEVFAESPPLELPKTVSASRPTEVSSENRIESSNDQPADVPAVVPPPESRRQWPWFVPAFVGAVLAIGFLGGCRLAWLLVSTRRIISHSRELSTGPVRRELHRLIQRCGKRIEVRLMESPDIAIPAAGGLLRRVILLPIDAESRFQPEELRALLAHELGHHVRGDVWWLWLGRAVCHLLPWQPLHFFAVTQWQWAAEPLCDDWALGQNISPIALAKSLTTAAQSQMARTVIGPAATSGSSQLTDRVERLLDRTSSAPPGVARRSMLLLMVLSAVCLIAVSPGIVLHSETKKPEPMPNAPDRGEKEEFWITETRSPRSQTEQLPSETTIPQDVLEALETTGSDLEQALQLLEAGDEDPKLREVVDRLRMRLNALRAKTHRIQKADARESSLQDSR